MGPTGQDKTATDSHISKGPKRACDCCRKRKVKCDAHSPCGPCKKAAIRCAYLQPPLKKGPKSLRSARVLTELRKIDEAGPSTSDSSISPAELRDWTWSSASSPNAAVPKSTAPRYSQTPPISIAPQSAHSEPFYFGGPSVPGFFPLAQTQARGPPVRVAFESNRWQSAERPPIFHRRQTPPSQHSDDLPSHLPSEIFLPYVLLFFNHLFPIMPIIDRETYLNPSLYNASSSFTSETYAFLCALSAATIVQLDAAAELPPFVVPPGIAPAHSPAELFVSECLRERAHFDYIDQPSTSTVMTSFFIFCYYGNEERHSQAWYYLQESITFAQTLDLDDENAIIKLDPVEAQWHRRLYWLLFVTERAYSIQRRKQTRLLASIQLPLVFESEDPELLNGFVNLVHLFSAVDEDFVRVWKGTRKGSVCNELWLAGTQRALDGAAVTLENISETQHIDIGVTRIWLHVLAWQMGVSFGLIWGKGDAGMRLDYPIELARRVVSITSGADRLALDSHGIGMEQKLSDVASCLTDVLKCSAGDASPTFAQGRQYLHLLLQQLSQMRGKESRYLQPLLSKMGDLMGFPINRSLPAPTYEEEMPVHGLHRAGMEGGDGRLGKVFDEEETRTLGPWTQPL